MSSFSSSSSLLRPLFFSFAAVATLAMVGCSGRVAEPTSKNESSVNGTNGTGGTGGTATSPTTSSACESKACGVDCTPEGSDEPFNCNSKGECVATGSPLACSCPEFLADCQKGDAPADTDGDGCIDACRPIK